MAGRWSPHSLSLARHGPSHIEVLASATSSFKFRIRVSSNENSSSDFGDMDFRLCNPEIPSLGLSSRSTRLTRLEHHKTDARTNKQDDGFPIPSTVLGDGADHAGTGTTTCDRSFPSPCLLLVGIGLIRPPIATAAQRHPHSSSWRRADGDVSSVGRQVR